MTWFIGNSFALSLNRLDLVEIFGYLFFKLSIGIFKYFRSMSTVGTAYILLLPTI